jgi:hypothetical protein
MGKMTVFVLGAGASAPFDYPLGRRLVTEILDYNPAPGTANAFDLRQHEQFKTALLQSAANSVDMFLERNERFVDIGRLAIARALIQYERTQTLWLDVEPEPANLVANVTRPRDNWYKYLFNRLVSGVPFEKVREWPIAFITFNYDRSLEQFLFMSVKAFYGQSDDQTKDALKDIPFIHLHGHLGLLPWQNKEGQIAREYSETASAGQIVAASKQIQIVHQAVPDSDEFNLARQLLSAADQIYVLGFGYNRTNIERLGLEKGKTAVDPLGTWVGLTTAEKASIKTKGCNVTFGDFGREGIVEFLCNNGGFLDREWTA